MLFIIDVSEFIIEFIMLVSELMSDESTPGSIGADDELELLLMTELLEDDDDDFEATDDAGELEAALTTGFATTGFGTTGAATGTGTGFGG